MYLLIFSVISMQLFEFFIWRNINNKFYNHFFSFGSSVLLLLQPFFSIMLISNRNIRNIILACYILIAAPYFIYYFSTKYIYSVVSKSGHLQWEVVDIEKTNILKSFIGVFGCFSFYLVSFIMDIFLDLSF